MVATTRTGGRNGAAGAVRSPDEPAPATKRSLVSVSHAIEAAVLAAPGGGPTVVVALFQRLAYFEREYAVYSRLADAGVHVVVGFSDGEAHEVPPGVDVVVLDADEPLADEWTVVAVGPEAGAFLVATDDHEIDPTEYTLEAGRCFLGRWSYSRVQAANELARLRIALGGRLDPDRSRVIDELLARVMPPGGAAAGSRGTLGEQWATASLARMTARMDDARRGSRVLRAQLADAQAAVAARTTAQIDPESGLPTPEFLARWAGSDGRPSALPVGLAVVDVPELQDAEQRHGRRPAYHAARQAAAALTEPLGPVDAAVRLSDREFAVVVPGASATHLARMAAAVSEQLEMYADRVTGLALSGRVATTVTLARPLPFDDLHLALGTPAHAEERPRTLAGDDIVVTDTRTLAGNAPAEETTGTGRWFRSRASGTGEPDADRAPSLRVAAYPHVADDLADDLAGDLDQEPAAGPFSETPARGFPLPATGTSGRSDGTTPAGEGGIALPGGGR